jgi:hypothetical protein
LELAQQTFGETRVVRVSAPSDDPRRIAIQHRERNRRLCPGLVETPVRAAVDIG